MDVAPIDPRDQTWEVDQPRYRVYFFEPSGSSDEYELCGADVPEVLRWAEAECHGRVFMVYACAPTSGLGLLRLSGTDPNTEHRPNGQNSTQ